MKQNDNTVLIETLEFVTNKLIEIMNDRGHGQDEIKLYTEQALKIIENNKKK